MNRIRRYGRLFRVFVRTCVVREMEFRGNFWAGTFLGVAWVAAYLVLARVIYANTHAVAGWKQGEAVMLMGTYTLASGLVAVLFQRNLAELPSQVRMGTFDFILVKPVNSQFFISLRYLGFTDIGTVLASIVLVWYGAALGGVRVSPEGVALYVFLLFCGIVIYYSIYLILMSTAFWFVRVENLWTLAESTFQVARTPMNVYGDIAMKVFTFVVPLIFIAQVPTEALASRANTTYLAVAVVMSAVLFVASSAFWRFATRFYTSASS